MKLKNNEERLHRNSTFVIDDNKEETEEKVGKRHSRVKLYSRWGSNPGNIRIGEEKVPVEVQRLYNKAEGQTEEVDYYQRLHALPLPSEEVMKKIDCLSSKRTIWATLGVSLRSLG